MTPDELDHELRAALSDPPASECTARLAAYWAQRSRAERRRRRLAQGAALAAALAGVAATWWLDARTHTPRTATSRDAAAMAKRDSDLPTAGQRGRADSPPATPRVALHDPRSAGRAATAYEAALFAVATRPAVDAAAEALTADVERIVQRLVADPAADVRDQVTALRLTERGAEAIVLRRLARTSRGQRKAVIELLALCGGPRSGAALVDAAVDADLRGPCLRAAEQIVGIGGLARLVPRTADAAVRRALLDRLLTADRREAVAGFLQLVADPALRGEALAAAAACAALPVDELLEALGDEQRDVRLAAALVLGHVDGPAIAQALMAAATREDRPPVEVWVALLACRDPAVDRFLAQAAVQPRRLSQVNNARAFWARLVP